jgi:hypothetical protein
MQLQVVIVAVDLIGRANGSLQLRDNWDLYERRRRLSRQWQRKREERCYSRRLVG